MTLPISVQRLFYRYHADRLDTVEHAAIIIPTVLEDGSLEDWNWLFDQYGWGAVRAWVAAQLGPPMQRFWTTVLLGTPQETPRWAGGNALRLVPEGAVPRWWPPDGR